MKVWGLDLLTHNSLSSMSFYPQYVEKEKLQQMCE